MRHVGLEAERLPPVDHLQQFDHPSPTVHTAPADFALGSQPLVVVLGDLAGLAERLGDPFLVAFGVFAPCLDATGRIDPHGAVGPHAQFAQPQGNAARLANLAKNFC